MFVQEKNLANKMSQGFFSNSIINQKQTKNEKTSTNIIFEHSNDQLWEK